MMCMQHACLAWLQQCMAKLQMPRQVAIFVAAQQTLSSLWMHTSQAAREGMPLLSGRR